MTDKKITVKALADMVHGQATGELEKIIEGFAPIDGAGELDVTFLANVKRKELLDTCHAGVVILPLEGMNELTRTVIRVKDPYLAAAIIHNYFLEAPFEGKGVHPRAVVGERCTLGQEITICPLAVIGDRVTIGERVCIEPGAVLGDDVTVGDDTTIKANVTVYKGCVIGKRVTIHSGTVIGSDGYGYSTNERGEHIKRPQVGIVRIDDDVEIGSNCCVDRAAYGVTWIKAGTKIDNQVQIAHNVVIGENCLIVAQVGISGSTSLGRNVVMGGQASATGHLKIGNRVMIAARGAVTHDQPDGALLGGTPAIPHRQWAKSIAIFNKLPELQATIRKNSKDISRLQSEADKE